jgi:hypothetical protein
MSFFRGLRKLNSILYFCRQGERIMGMGGRTREPSVTVVSDTHDYKNVPCPSCFGVPVKKGFHCTFCKGWGYVVEKSKKVKPLRNVMVSSLMTKSVDCFWCHGACQVKGKKCVTCNGTGTMKVVS